MTDSEAKLKHIADKLTSLEAHTCPCSNAVTENSAPMVMLERQISKNFAEINKMVLDLDIHPASSSPPACHYFLYFFFDADDKSET